MRSSSNHRPLLTAVLTQVGNGPPIFDGALVPAVAVEACLPAHTRASLARCLVDLHSNSVPKDLAFLMHHGQALKPRSALGWLVSFVLIGGVACLGDPHLTCVAG